MILLFYSDYYEKSYNSVGENGLTRIHLAAWKGQVDDARLLIEKGADINAEDVFGRKPIHVAAENNNKNIIEFFLSKGVSIDDADRYGRTPLYYASGNGNLDIVKCLVEKGADINAQDKGGETSLDAATDQKHDGVVGYLKQVQLDQELLIAAQYGNFNEVKDLVSKGAEIKVKDKDGKTLFHVAAQEGKLRSIRFLIGKIESMNFEDNLYAEPDELVKAVRQRERLKSLINEKDKFGYTPLQYAAKNAKWDIVNLFLDKTAERNQDDVADKDKFSTSWTTVHYAVYNGNMSLFNDIFQFLSDKETIINTKDSSDWTPLHYAVYYNALDVVKFLVNKGADINAKDKDGKTPLDLAVQGNETSVAEFLKQTQLDKKLLAAAQNADINEVKDLINQKANINAKDMYDWTPLHFAASRDKLSVVEFLFNNNANIKAKDVYGNTSLHVAAQYSSNLEIVKFLLDKGISSINATTNNGWTPLHLAIQGNKLNTVEFLLDRGADIEVRDIYNQTSLDLATRKGYLDIAGILKQVERGKELLTAVQGVDRDKIRDLIMLGAKLEVKDNDGNTPLCMASLIGELDIVQYLVSKGANINAKNKDDKTPLDSARDKGYNNIVNYLEEELNKEREKPLQRKRRHHHGDHARHNMSRKPLAIDSSNQPEIATSSAIKPSSWINDLFGWVKSSIGGLLDSKSSTTTKSPISQIDATMDVNGTIMLLDVLVRKVTGQKYVSTVDQSISPLEAQGYALNITNRFEKVVDQAGLKSGVSMHRLNIDYMGMQKEITRKVMSGKFNEISGILKSYVEKACPGEEVGKLSPKKFDKFIAQFNKGLLNQSIEQILHNGDGTLEVDDAKQMSLEPQSYLSNASVHSHSKVSTCLSEIGLTKLGGNLNR